MRNEVWSGLRTALAAAAAGAVLAGCPAPQPFEEPDGGVPQNDGGIPQNDGGIPQDDGGVPLPDEEFPVFTMDACVTDQELTETEKASRPTLSGALRFDEIIKECKQTTLQGERDGRRFRMCGNWGRVEAGHAVQEKLSYCLGIAGLELPVDNIAVYVPSGVVHIRDGNRHGLIDLREDIPTSVNITDQRKISACAYEVLVPPATSPDGTEDIVPGAFWVRELLDCLGDSLPPDNPEGDKLPFVWHNIP